MAGVKSLAVVDVMLRDVSCIRVVRRFGFPNVRTGEGEGSEQNVCDLR